MPDPSPPPLRVHVVADDPLARGALRRSLEDAGVQVVRASAPSDVGEIGAGADVVAWDLGVQGGGAEAFGDVSSLVPVVALVADERSSGASGARGVVFRDADGARLAAALRAVAEGFVVREPASPAATRDDRPREPDELTPREREVLGLLVEGLSNKLLAARLGISEHTAKFHVNAVMQKLGAATRTEAVVRAVRGGLVTL